MITFQYCYQDASIKVDGAGSSRGFGFVLFECSESVSNVSIAHFFITLLRTRTIKVSRVISISHHRRRHLSRTFPAPFPFSLLRHFVFISLLLFNFPSSRLSHLPPFRISSCISLLYFTPPYLLSSSRFWRKSLTL